jgi:hypothetical protein
MTTTTLPAARTVRCWIETVTTIRGTRFRVVEEGILFPGRRNAVRDTWAQRSSARAYINRRGGAFVAGPCPLPAVSEAERAAYHADSAARRAAVAAKAA